MQLKTTISTTLLIIFSCVFIEARIIQTTDHECIFPESIQPVLPDIHLEEERVKGLDAFWAQEYVGADLLRKKLKEISGMEEATKDLVQIWDTNDYFHGEYVSHIIAGPFPSAVIPQAHPIDVTALSGNIHKINDYEYLYRQCQNENSCPAYINISLYWKDRATREVLYAMNRRQGTVIVTSAGNLNKYLPKLKGSLEKLNRLIVVASLNPLGSPSHFSNYSTNITISAPSDDMIRSYNFDGTPHNFGGTSGATPLVTGALTAFTQITHYLLDAKQAKNLLKRTAMHFPRLPSSNSMGAGILNAYKIGEIGFKLNKICQNNRNKEACISSNLDLDKTYEFNLEEEKMAIIRDAQNAFPTCFSEKNTPSNNTTCEDKHHILEKLRQTAFLDSSDKTLWQTISCIKKESGLTKHAEFYTGLAERLDMSDEEIIDNIIANQDYLKLKYVISKENINQIIMFMLDEAKKIKSQFLAFALRSIEDILQYYEDIPNLEDILTKAIHHDSADKVVFSAVSDIIKDNFDKISNAEDILRYMINNRNAILPTLYPSLSLLPTLAISNNLNKLSDPESFLRMIIDSPRVKEVDLTNIINGGLFRYRQRLPHFRQLLDKILNHKISKGTVIKYVFLNMIKDYNNIPNAKDISSPLINSDKLNGEYLGMMAATLIENYNQNLDFKEMLQSIINRNKANSQTFSHITYSLIQHSESFEDFNFFFSTIINHEKIDRNSVVRATVSFIKYYNNLSDMVNIFQSITNNQHISAACSIAAFTIINNSSPNSQHYMPTISNIPQKLRLIYSNCDHKIDLKDLPTIRNSIRMNTVVRLATPVPMELDMLKFIIRQKAIDQRLIDSISDMTQKMQITDEIREQISYLIREAQQNILDRQ